MIINQIAAAVGGGGIEPISFIPYMTSNTNPMGIASSSTQLSATYATWRAFDGLYNTLWSSSATGMPQWLAYQLELPQIVTRYTIQSRHDWGKYGAPTKWTFEGFNGIDWVILDSQANITDWAYAETKMFDILNSVPYISYRINFEEIIDGQEAHIGEFQLYNTNGTESMPELLLHLDGINNTGSGHDLDSLFWRDLTSTVPDAQIVAGNIIWGDKYLRLDGNSYWNVDSPNGSVGTLEVVVSLDSDFTPVNNSNWYNCSCIVGRELSGTHKDYGIIINNAGMFSIGYSTSTIVSSGINALDGEPHTISYFYNNGPRQFSVDDTIINTYVTTVSGNEISNIGIGWQGLTASTRIRGKVYSIKWYNSRLSLRQIRQNHANNKKRFGF